VINNRISLKNQLTLYIYLLLFLMLFHRFIEYLMLFYIIFGYLYFALINRFIVSLPNELLLLILLFLFSIFFSYIINFSFQLVNFRILFNGFILLMIVHLAFLFGSNLNTRDLFSFLRLFVFISLINSIANIFQWFSVSGGVVERYNFVSPILNTYSGGINLSSISFFITLSLNFRSKLFKSLLLIIFFVNIVIIVSRLNQVIFLIQLILYILIRLKNTKQIVKLSFISTLGFIFFLLLINTNVFQSYLINYYSSFLNLSSVDYSVRFNTYLDAIKIFISNPIFGIGYGFYSLKANNAFDLASTHNGFLSFLVEFGMVGTVVFLFLSFFIIIKLFKYIHFLDPIYNVLSISTIIICITFFISNSDLLPPPSERTYYLFAFFSWIIIAFLIKKKASIKIKTS